MANILYVLPAPDLIDTGKIARKTEKNARIRCAAMDTGDSFTGFNLQFPILLPGEIILRMSGRIWRRLPAFPPGEALWP